MAQPNISGVFVLQVDKRLDGDVFNNLLKKVQTAKRDRITKFYRWEDAHLSLFAELLIRIWVTGYMKWKNTEVLFSTSHYGKPIITDLPSLHFNVSHSGNWVVLAIDNYDVGIDIEKIEDIDMSIAENYFYCSEYTDIVHSENPKCTFFEYWTLKESYIKHVGKGLSIPLNSFCIKKNPDGEIAVEVNGDLLKNIYFKQYNIGEAYKMAVCTSNSNFLYKHVFYQVQDVVAAANALTDFS